MTTNDSTNKQLGINLAHKQICKRLQITIGKKKGSEQKYLNNEMKTKISDLKCYGRLTQIFNVFMFRKKIKTFFWLKIKCCSSLQSTSLMDFYFYVTLQCEFVTKLHLSLPNDETKKKSSKKKFYSGKDWTAK